MITRSNCWAKAASRSSGQFCHFYQKYSSHRLRPVVTLSLTSLEVLSIQKALPLQIHPDKDLAARLHSEDPEKYSDDNHKPEIAVALGPFEVFAGWKPTSDIEALFSNLEPLKRFLPKDVAQFDNETLKLVCQNILKSSDVVIKATQEQLGKLPKESFGKQSYILDLLPRLQSQYSIEDPGNLVALWWVD